MRANGAPYNMAKSALEALALTMAKEEIGHGIRVNIAAPGPRRHRHGRQARPGQARRRGHDRARRRPAAWAASCRPADVARVVRFLVSSDADFVTGQRIVVDGGADASPTGAPAAAASARA